MDRRRRTALVLFEGLWILLSTFAILWDNVLLARQAFYVGQIKDLDKLEQLGLIYFTPWANPAVRTFIIGFGLVILALVVTLTTDFWNQIPEQGHAFARRPQPGALLRQMNRRQRKFMLVTQAVWISFSVACLGWFNFRGAQMIERMRHAKGDAGMNQIDAAYGFVWDNPALMTAFAGGVALAIFAITTCTSGHLLRDDEVGPGKATDLSASH